MKVSVIGSGRWGTFIAWYLNSIGHEVTLCGRAGSESLTLLQKTRKNKLLTLPDRVAIATLPDGLLEAEIILVSVASQALGSLLQGTTEQIAGKPLVLCMKGLESKTGRRLSQIAQAETKGACPVAVWLGPGHVQEFIKGVPNCMVIDSQDDSLKHCLVEAFSSDLIRFYYGQDMLGNEIGAAAKNVVGIAAGMLDGLGLSALKGALISRGTREMARLISALGGNELSAYGLCHLGDYEATVFSKHSHNRMFGECFIAKQPFTSLAEGYYTAEAMMALQKRSGVELPICSAVYRLLYEKADPAETLNKLFSRSVKSEF